ncbi:hypothetical protein [Mycolicibacterium lacusdiani]|uniref:hypothetical protein n=1 Tax=Mycolicibacterium lacusdiani TaxID=2895283 RepID=UPI001F29A9DF|nr:hypothetical protein [Mycolicibacterium lacusdiani]
MQMALRPYVTAGIALVGASVIAVAPIAPHPDVQLPAVQLSAAIDNPIEVFTPVVNAAGAWLTNTIRSEIANPFPILHQIVTNQITTAGQLLQAVNAGGAALGDLAAGLPATLQTAFAKLAVGDVNGAIDSVIASGLNPIVNLITGVWTPLQEVLQRPFAVGQALVPALFNAGLSLALAAVASTVGIGFDTGLKPLVQQIVSSTQSVLNAVTTLNPINVLNAIQHGFADVALNVFAQLDSFTTGTLPFIRDSIIAALQATPAAALTATVATTPDTTAAIADTAEMTKAAITSGSSESTGEASPSDPPPTDGTPSTPAAASSADEEATGTVPTDVETTDETEETATGTADTKIDPGEEDSLTRDSVKAEPGKVGTEPAGGASGGSNPTGEGSAGAATGASGGTQTAGDSTSDGASDGDSDSGSGDGASSGNDD